MNVLLPMYMPLQLREASEDKSVFTHAGLALLAYGLVAVTIPAIIASIQYPYPIAYVYFIREDGLVENSTAIADALAGCALVWQSRRTAHPLYRVLLIAAGTAACCLAAEE